MAVSRVLSIEITDTLTKLCEVSYNKKVPTVYKSFTFENPEGTVGDGFILDRGVYGSYLKEQLDNQKIKCKDVVFILGGTKIMSREAVIPEMKDELILGFIHDERDEYFPMDTSEYVFTYNVLDRNKVEHNMRIMIYAAQEILLKNLIALSGELDMKLRAIDYEGNAIYQWQKKPYHEPINIYLQINERNSMLTIMENGVLSLQRNMAFGVAALVDRLQMSNYYDNISRANAVDRLCEKELMYASYENMNAFCPEDDDENKLHNVKCSMNEAVRPLIENITRVLEYYNSKSRDAVVDKIYIGGIGAEVKNLRKLLQSEFLGIEFVKVLDLPGVKIHKNNPLVAKKASEYTACIGASEETINFYEDKDKYKLSTTLIFCFAMLILAIAASVLIILNGKSQYDNAVYKRDRLKAEQAVLETENAEALEAQAENALAGAEALKQWDEATFRFNEYWNDILANIETYSVQDVLVSSVGSAETGLSMNVTVNSKEEAALFIEQLRYIPYFDEVQVYSIAENIDEETGRVSVAFSVVCTYKVPEETEENAGQEGGEQ